MVLSHRPKQTELIPVSLALGCLGVLLLPPVWHACPSQGNPPSPPPQQYSTGTHLSFLSRERLSGVKFLV